MTSAKVLAIFAAEVAALQAAGEPPAGIPLQAYRGTRTRIHEALQAKSPAPYTAAPDHIKPDDGRLTHSDLAEIHAHMRAQPTDAEHLKAAKARSGPDGNFTDTHHYVQREHARALWVEVDRLTKAAGITEAGRT